MSGRRSVLASLVVLVVTLGLVGTACGSSGGASDESTTSGPATSAPAPSTPASALPTSTTSATPGSEPVSCRPLMTALEVEDLQPRNLGNWPAERQRIITDTASNVALYRSAAATAPSELVAPLAALVTYATSIGTSVSSAGSFDAAVAAITAYPDTAGASRAATTVANWRRTNCR